MRKLLCIFFTLLAVTLSASDIAIVTLAVGNEYKEKVKIGTESKKNYCKMHDYDFLYSEESQDPSRHVYWSKILYVLKALENPNYKWVVWMDADTIIMNPDIPLDFFIDEKFHFIIGKDWNGINSGVFFVKNSDICRTILKQVYESNCQHPIWPEQAAIANEIHKPEFSPYAKIVPQRLFNSYPPETLPPLPALNTCYKPGDFLLHFASVGPNGSLVPLFEKYSEKIVNDRNLITLDHFLGFYGFELSPVHSSNNEGFMSEDQKKQFQEQLLKYPHIQTIAEIGLNGGHSADNFFQNCKRLKKFLSFDINRHPYTAAAVEFFSRKYGHVFEFIPGDSKVTVPKYLEEHPDQKFDLIYIDGGHSYEQCLEDLMNTIALSHKNTIIWLDDFNDAGIQKAAHTLQEKGVLSVSKVFDSWGSHGYRCWAVIIPLQRE